ncbi:MAG TPA: hypothetical protein VNQ77_17460 [Frankiaceae bacterium]|nr:hypothetical protein [Frankiaceae bacterium]
MTTDPALPADAIVGDRFHMRQKITPFQNVYRVFADANGEPGALVAYAKQKRLTLRESFTLFSDERATQPILAIQADRAIDISSAMMVSDPATGTLIGTLHKRGGRSLFRSTWEIDQPGTPIVTVQERNLVIAILRRVWGFIPQANNVPVPWVFHFDGTSSTGDPVLSHTRRWGIRDRYVLEIASPLLDRRLAIAMAVCLDAMQHR